MFLTIVTSYNIVSQSCCCSLWKTDEEMRIKGKRWWEQGELGGGLLESPVVNLQTASQSGNDARQESSSLTAPINSVIGLRLISLSSISLFLVWFLMYLPPSHPLFHSLYLTNQRGWLKTVTKSPQYQKKLACEHFCDVNDKFDDIDTFWNRRPHKAISVCTNVKCY